MRERLAFAGGYYLYWLVYFLFVKAVFLIYHQELSSTLSFSQIAGVFQHGLPLDLSFSAYLCLIPFLLITISSLLPGRRWLPATLMIYTNLVLFLVTFICTADLELFKIWGFRMDASPLNYLNTPEEMMVSVGSSPIFLLVILNVLINVFFSFLYRTQLAPLLQAFAPVKRYWSLAFLFLTAALILPLRGGLQEIPINQSSAYFSRNHFANQAAINLPWNFFHAISKWKSKEKHPYQYLAPATADSLLQTLYKDSIPTSQDLLTSKKPNIIFIIWESFTAKVAEPLGGAKGVTPRFTELSKEGLLFSRLYASGDRTDKGLISILSGYPAQPIATIMKTPDKSRKLPQISINLARAGYNTAFFYGGELGFGNMGSYLSFGEWQHITSVKNFSGQDLNSKWGAHDGVVLNRVMHHLDTMQQPFFSTVLTLSSHEPFDLPVPAKGQFPGSEHDELFMSAHYYSDSVIYNFVQQAKQQPWWDNTLIVIIADHGHGAPGQLMAYEAKRFHIPMLWLGGALKAKGEVWQHTLSQTDLAPTLLKQLGISAEEFKWGRNALVSDRQHFASYFFKDGVGFITDSSNISWDNVGKLVIEEGGNASEQELIYAKGYLQKSFGDYLSK